MPLAAAGVVKLGDGVMPLAAATPFLNNIMPLAVAAPLAAAAVAKRAKELRPSAPPPLPPMLPGRLTQGMLSDCQRFAIRGSINVNKG